MNLILRVAVAIGMVVAAGACSGSDAPPAAKASPFNPFATAASSDASSPFVPPPTLSIGDCFDTDEFAPGTAIDLRRVHLVACADPHQHEVYGVELAPHAGRAPFPGDEALVAFADEACLAAFTPTLGVDYRASTLDFAAITPDEASWTAGGRAVICALHDANFALLTGSLRTTTTTSLAAERR